MDTYQIDAKVTEGEIRAAISWHLKQAEYNKEEMKIHNERAAELTKLVTFSTVSVTGAGCR